MFFKGRSEKLFEKRNKLKKLEAEISDIWNPEFRKMPSDTNGSYTGNPSGFEKPEQDADDL